MATNGGFQLFEEVIIAWCEVWAEQLMICIFISIFQYTTELTVQPWCKKSISKTSFLSQNTVHMIFYKETLIWIFYFRVIKCASMPIDCCFDSEVACAWSPVTIQLRKLSPSSLKRVKKPHTVLPFHLSCSTSNYGTSMHTISSSLVFQTWLCDGMTVKTFLENSGRAMS